ncbi:MAG: hypothetical protein KA138_01860 [Saprospiraceae bacterium]|nr:hypothetical protein [Saprospiraceae bacterium]
MFHLYHFQIMTTRTFFLTLTLFTISFFILSCEKTTLEAPIVKVTPTVPDGSRIIIHFGTSTQRGCIYSFTNCIWIGWEHAKEIQGQNLAFLFEDAEVVNADYGDFFPVTADFTLETPAGTPSQVLQAGFYRFQPLSDGQKMISFSDSFLLPVAPLVNPNNPQDNLGQLHNLAMQALYTAKTKDELKAMDIKAAQKMLAAKSVQFLASEAEIVISPAEQAQIENATFDEQYDNHHAWLQSSSLSTGDQKVLGDILDMASAMPVNSTEQLSDFVSLMTELENGLAQNATIDNPKLLLSAISVAKYSRYFWYWKCLTHDQPASVPNWWKADVKGLIEGGIGQALVDSLLAAVK